MNEVGAKIYLSRVHTWESRVNFYVPVDDENNVVK